MSLSDFLRSLSSLYNFLIQTLIILTLLSMTRFCLFNDRALERLDLLSKNTHGENSFIIERRRECIRKKEILEKRFRTISEVMSHYHMHNPHGLDENDLYGFMKFVCDESGESIDDIVRGYKTLTIGPSSFMAICGYRLHYIHWERIIAMYNEGKLGDL